MLQKLEFMIALAREKHFGKAAASCGVAQPTFSLGIQGLEEMLNVPLVKRSSRFQGFTPQGDLVLVWARRLVGDAHAMRQELFGLQKGVGSLIRIAALPTTMPIVASLTAPFQIRNPGVRFTLLARPSNELLGLLEQREIDVGVTYIDNEPVGDVIKVPLYEERYLLLTTLDRPFGCNESVAWSDLAALPFCMFTPNLQHRRIIDSVLRTVGIEITPRIETDSIMAITAHVSTGNWVSIVPRSILSTISTTEKLRAIPIVEPNVTRTIGLVVSERFPIQPTIASLIEEVRGASADGVSRARLSGQWNDCALQ
jgi:DNA-binding transcriptional LysR family regulator